MAGGSAGAFQVGRGDDLGAVTFEQFDGNQQFRPPCTEDRRYRRAVGLGGFRQRRQGCESRAPSDRHDMTQVGIEREADPERAHDIDAVAGDRAWTAPACQRRRPYRETRPACVRGRRRKGSWDVAETAARLRCEGTAVERTDRARRRRKQRCIATTRWRYSAFTLAFDTTAADSPTTVADHGFSADAIK